MPAEGFGEIDRDGTASRAGRFIERERLRGEGGGLVVGDEELRVGQIGWEGFLDVATLDGDDAFAAFDFGFLHVDGPVVAVEFVVEAASVADGVARFVATPERGDGCATVLTCLDYILPVWLAVLRPAWSSVGLLKRDLCRL